MKNLLVASCKDLGYIDGVVPSDGASRNWLKKCALKPIGWWVPNQRRKGRNLASGPRALFVNLYVWRYKANTYAIEPIILMLWIVLVF